jgi:hypothetical protein
MSLSDLMVVLATVLAFAGSVTLIVVVVERLSRAQKVDTEESSAVSSSPLESNIN